ncbi:MAG: hypothetical protein Q8P73_02195 [bacterium]|nr:hypothetical protein [bacterium]
MDKKRSPDGKGFKLKLHEKDPDAPLSPFYLNLRTPDNPKAGPLTPAAVAMIGRKLFRMAQGQELTFDHVAGLPNAGDPIAEAFYHALLASGRTVGLLKLVKATTADQRHITSLASGAYERGDEVLVVDDLITMADTKLEGIGVLENAGLIVRDVLVVLDRQQGGGKQLLALGYNLRALLTLEELLDIYVGQNVMTNDERRDILDYVRTA